MARRYDDTALDGDRDFLVRQMRVHDRQCRRAAWWGMHGGSWPPLNWPRVRRQDRDLWGSWRGGVMQARNEWWRQRWLAVKRLIGNLAR